MNFIPNAAGKYSASITGENGCSALSATKNLNTIPATPGNISGPKYITGGQQAIIYRTQKIAGLTYNWTVPPDATIVAGQGNWAIRVNWGFTNGNVTVSAINGCGASPAKLKKIFLSEIGRAHV